MLKDFSDSVSDISVKANPFFIFKELMETVEVGLRGDIYTELDLYGRMPSERPA